METEGQKAGSTQSKMKVGERHEGKERVKRTGVCCRVILCCQCL